MGLVFVSIWSVHIGWCTNPFILKVIIDIYVPIGIFLTVLGFFLVGLAFLLCLLAMYVPLAYVTRMVWWC